jgi:hypothetical protein
MNIYNLLSCKGFVVENAKTTLDIGGPCSSARLGLVALFFINALVRKWGGEELDIEYNFWLGMGGAFLGYIIPLTFLGSIKISFIIGVVAMIIGGYFGGSLFGGSDEY